MLQQQPVRNKAAQIRSDEVCEQLKGFFQSTDWDILCTSHGEDNNSLTRCITDYNNVCVGKHCAIQKGTFFPKQQTLVDLI